MISIEQARHVLWEHVTPLAPVGIPLARSRGTVLAEAVVADMDFPPFDRALMDGYAVRADDLGEGATELPVVGSAAAGGAEGAAVAPGQAVQINTGAPVPPGADAVVMFEKTQPLDDGRRVRILGPVPRGTAIMPRAAEAAAGSELLGAGTRLGAAQIAVAASCGARELTVYPRPRVAILATGDELVDCSRRPGPGQIRNSNSPQLQAMVEAAGAVPVLMGIARDDRAHLAAQIARGLEEAHVLLLTGGVSMGTADFVPDVLRETGVETRFHKVAVKPGKPTLFATAPGGKYVLGMPGNPVSTYVCFHFFAMAILEGLVGRGNYWPPAYRAVLTGPLGRVGDRQSYLPAVLTHDESGRPEVRPTAWRGSGDPFGLARGNALIERPPDAPPAEPGEAVRVYPLGV